MLFRENCRNRFLRPGTHRERTNKSLKYNPKPFHTVPESVSQLFGRKLRTNKYIPANVAMTRYSS